MDSSNDRRRDPGHTPALGLGANRAGLGLKGHQEDGVDSRISQVLQSLCNGVVHRGGGWRVERKSNSIQEGL